LTFGDEFITAQLRFSLQFVNYLVDFAYFQDFEPYQFVYTIEGFLCNKRSCYMSQLQEFCNIRLNFDIAVKEKELFSFF
jgi:hypothetical protein